MTDSIEMVFGQQHLGFAIGYFPTCFCKVVEKIGPLGTPGHIGPIHQLPQLLRSFQKIELRGMLQLLDGEVSLHRLVFFAIYTE